MFKVLVNGPLGLRDEHGNDCTPRGKKTRGMLAILLFSKDFRRSRAWLQDKLWSDRGPEQAAASLRQSLSELRRALGARKDLVKTANGCVQLDPDAFTREAFTGDDASTLLEDLDINDREFENWLRDLRQSHQPRPTLAPAPEGPIRPTVLVGLTDRSMPQQGVGHLLKDEVIRNLLELSDLQIFDLDAAGQAEIAAAGPSVFVRLFVSAVDGNSIVSARLETTSGHATVWQSATELIAPSASQADDAIWRLRCLGQSIVAHTMDELERQTRCQEGPLTAQALFNRAYHTIFGFRRQDLIEADRLLKAAYTLEPRGSYLSWRAFIRNTAMFEHLTDDFLEHCDSSELHEVGLTSDPLNSHTLIFAAQHSFVNDGDAGFGMMLVDKALERNPSNPLGWGFRSNMLILQDNFAEARIAAERGLQLSQGQPVSATMSIFACMADIANQDLEKAMRDARYGTMTASRCQALRRFLFALFRALEMPADANRELEILRQREPDFKAACLTDRSYPMRTLHRLPIVDRLSR